REDVDGVINHLAQHRNEKDYFYEIRSQEWREMPPVQAAARTIFLNRTCFNGLYRVNRSGGFNVPFGHYKNPKILNEVNLRSVSAVLQGIEILLGDYKDVLAKKAEPNDLIFLDPPYLPVSKY